MDKAQFLKACSEGNVELGEWDPLWTSQGLKEAARNGHAEMVNLLLVRDPVREESDRNAVSMAACEGGHLSLFKRAVGVSEPYDIECGLLGAGKGGHRDLIMSLVEMLPPLAKRDGYVEAAFGAAKAGHLALVQWIVEEVRTKWSNRPFYDELLLHAIAGGQLEVAAWCFSFIPPNNVPQSDLYRNACASGKREVVQWVVDHFAFYGMLPTNAGLMAACRAGHRDIIDWMLELGANDDRFLSMCYGGQLDLVKSLDPLTMAQMEMGFQVACEQGRYELALWFIEQGVDPRKGIAVTKTHHYGKLHDRLRALAYPTEDPQ